MSRPVEVGLLGLGNVAQGLLELWSARPDPRFKLVFAADSKGAVTNAAGLEPAALLSAKRGGSLEALRGARHEASPSLDRILEKSRPRILLNLLPCNYENGGPALPLLRSALETGVHVVTAEKASLVLGFEALRKASRNGNTQLRYSACVGGSIPFIPLLEWVAQAHEIKRVTGVFNATTTYILSELEARRHTPTEILDKARTLGILEADPRLDLEGFDLAAKAVLVHNTIYKDLLPFHRADRKGITSFLQAPDTLRTGTRLVASIEPGKVAVEASVLPMHSPLRVYGLENAVLIETAHAGDLHVRGVGAGGRGTATNVYGDLVRVATLLEGGEPNPRTHVPQAALQPHL